MFKFLKDKLKGFFKKSSEKIIEASKEKAEEIAKEPRGEISEPVLGEKYRKPRVSDEETKKRGGKEVRKPEKEIESKEEVKEKKEDEKQIKPKEGKQGFFARIKERFVFKIDEKIFQNIWDDLETLLLEGNVAFEVVKKIKSELQKELVGREIEKDGVEEFIKEQLKNAIFKLMVEPFDLIKEIKSAKKPYVITFFGINGSGKTTTIAKLARFLQQRGLICVLAASDTFRAASIEQLEKHADNLNIKMIKQDYGADAAAVAFDAISYARAHSTDVVLIDTAGRMHTQSNLMREMEKICRVTKPNLKIFIGEAITGNDMLEQAKSFSESIGIDCIILSKADVDDKGGTAISVSYVTKKPIIFLGTGQKYENFEPSSREKILNNLGLS